MKAENLEFGEALRQLAQQTGVTLPSAERRSEVQSAFDLNEAAKSFFQQRLASSQGRKRGRTWKGRGLNRETIAHFELGLSPNDGESLRVHLEGRGYSPEQLAEAGLVSSGNNGSYRDMFRRRLMIPIRNGQGELAGFGGRALDDSNPKYLNSPRTAIFDKGRILFALNVAREHARQQGMVVVEGYMDAIMAHQHGYRNVVASMGTALTETQVAEARRVTGNITMALDADAAGQQATLRSLESSWKVFQVQPVGRVGNISMNQRRDGGELKVVSLPEGMDPDEVIRRAPEEWPAFIENAKPLFDFLLPALSAQVDIGTAQGKSWVVEQLRHFVAAVPDAIVQDHYLQQMAHHLRVNEETLRASMGSLTPQRARTGPRANRPAQRDAGGTDSAFTQLEHDPVRGVLPGRDLAAAGPVRAGAPPGDGVFLEAGKPGDHGTHPVRGTGRVRRGGGGVAGADGGRGTEGTPGLPAGKAAPSPRLRRGGGGVGPSDKPPGGTLPAGSEVGRGDAAGGYRTERCDR